MRGNKHPHKRHVMSIDAIVYCPLEKHRCSNICHHCQQSHCYNHAQCAAILTGNPSQHAPKSPAPSFFTLVFLGIEIFCRIHNHSKSMTSRWYPLSLKFVIANLHLAPCWVCNIEILGSMTYLIKHNIMALVPIQYGRQWHSFDFVHRKSYHLRPKSYPLRTRPYITERNADTADITYFT